ncbi:Leucine-rich repeat flightless-interacting protein 2 [Holothuria leucospilota]|uniref:Leucine-rich repeat flightless-interacting protein 2 n=1 Tax=Holothuria leucospilota TaxID=206669 RepID=A0A9Q0YMR7_HOLLE|nr:Leucine-rich repeat flightless-interacting protein 2 [Holothuria leucospilota]
MCLRWILAFIADYAAFGNAEMKLTAKRAARAEARDIRLKEMEKQQKESEEQEGKDADQDRDEKRASSDSWGRVRRRLSQLKRRVDSIDGEEALLRQTTTTSVSSSRRSSADSIEQDAAKVELEEKYKKAMMTNAQLDNEKTTLVYEVEALKDMVEDRDEQMMEYQREAKEKHRDLQAKKRENANLVKEIEHLKELVIQRDQLIADHGLLFVCDEDGEVRQEEKEKEISEERRKKNSQIGTIVVISPEASQLLEFSGDGPLDVRLKRLVEERKELMEEVRKLKIELDEEKERVLAAERRQASPSESMNGPDVELLDLHRETTRQATEYKYKLQRTEQEIATLEGNVLRLESQVKRYKAAAEASEKIEEELKVEKRKTTRELRSLRDRVDELETENGSLKKRIEKFRKREIHS